MLANNHGVYTIPGWGFSAKLLNPLATTGLNMIGLEYFKIAESSLDAIAKRLANTLPDNTALLGWSLGGLIAIKIALLFPEKIRKLILISSQPKFLSDRDWQGIDPSVGAGFIKEFCKDAERQISRFISLVNYPSRESKNKTVLSQSFAGCYTERLLLLLRILFNADLRESYQALAIEILHIINNEDAVIKQNESQLKALNPNISTVSLEKLGHAGFLDNYLTYQTIIRNFLSL